MSAPPVDDVLVAALLARLDRMADSAIGEPDGMNIEDLVGGAWFADAKDEDEPSIHPMSPAVAAAAVHALLYLLMGDPILADPSGPEFRRIVCERIANAYRASVTRIQAVDAAIRVEDARGSLALLPQGGKVVPLRGGES